MRRPPRWAFTRTNSNLTNICRLAGGCFFYLGSSLAGTAGGYVWTHFHWSGVIAFVIALLALSGPLIFYAEKRRPSPLR
ncbi:hypothetical protein B9L19_10915 [Geobacillus thermocatenulatus]|uniref:Major facilitator superfamily (MFS) profile domain-containing protein n=1 Tax=Geobacillus thermocatenulatus TaxID=33938 RepID=A0AA91QJZ3_9BACL|nr:hypothetical protein B9L19_10915 [Geobacillus thermocatenulatus]